MATAVAAPTSALATCIDCAQEIDARADMCRMGCGHQLHLACLLRLYTNHGISQCFKCSGVTLPSPSSNGNVLLRLDFGQDANVRHALQEQCVMPASAMTRATFTDRQPCLKPVDSSTSKVPSAIVAMKDNPVLAPMAKRILGPDVSFVAQNSAEHVHHALHQGFTTHQLMRAGITADHLIAANITWRHWHDLGYGIRDAVCLGARWRNLLDMGFGDGLAKHGTNDYHQLREPPLQVSFSQFLQDVFHNSYAALAEKRLDAFILCALGLQWDTLLRLKLATHQDMTYFSYIPLEEMHTYMEVTRTTMLRERFSLEFLQHMRWTKEQLEAHLRVTVVDLQQLYGHALTLAPVNNGPPRIALSGSKR